MTIGTLQVLLKLADTTNPTVVNSGTLGTNYTAAGTSTTRAASNGLYSGSGRLSGSSNSSGAQTSVFITGAASPGTGLRCISGVIGFNIASFNDGAAKLVTPNSSTTDGNINVTCNPNGSGYDVSVTVRHSGGAGTADVVLNNGGTPIAFGSNNIVSWGVDMNTASAVILRAKLNSNAVQASASANFATQPMEAGWPRLLHRLDFPGTPPGFGFNGDMHLFGLMLSLTDFWDPADLASVNADPTILWGGGATVDPSVATDSSTGFLGPMNGFGHMFRRAWKRRGRIFVPDWRPALAGA